MSPSLCTQHCPPTHWTSILSLLNRHNCSRDHVYAWSYPFFLLCHLTIMHATSINVLHLQGHHVKMHSNILFLLSFILSLSPHNCAQQVHWPVGCVCEVARRQEEMCYWPSWTAMVLWWAMMFSTWNVNRKNRYFYLHLWGCPINLEYLPFHQALSSALHSV
jgi:hypothetical protein